MQLNSSTPPPPNEIDPSMQMTGSYTMWVGSCAYRDSDVGLPRPDLERKRGDGKFIATAVAEAAG